MRLFWARVGVIALGITLSAEPSMAQDRATSRAAGHDARPRLDVIVVEPDVEPQPPPPPNCHVPVPFKDARIIRLGAREGGRISNIAIGGQDDTAYVATVEVERGKKPVYVVATNNGPTIWHFTGETSRLQAVVLSGWSSNNLVPHHVSGAVGVPRYKVIFVDRECFGDFAENQDGRYFTRGHLPDLISAHLGRRPAGHYARYRFEGIAIPSMHPFELKAVAPPEFKLPSTAATAVLWFEFVTHFNGGLANFRSDEVIAPEPAIPYRTYPYQAGLLQLTLNGSIEPATVNGSSGYYRILKPIQLPSGLNGGYAQNFIVADGVPAPTGSPGHSKVIRENDHTCIMGCR